MAKPEYGLASNKAAIERAKVPEAPRVKWELVLRCPAKKLEGCAALPLARLTCRLVAHAATKGHLEVAMREKPRKVKSLSYAFNAGELCAGILKGNSTPPH